MQENFLYFLPAHINYLLLGWLSVYIVLQKALFLIDISMYV
jgi:hypothetical protein